MIDEMEQVYAVEQNFGCGGPAVASWFCVGTCVSTTCTEHYQGHSASMLVNALAMITGNIGTVGDRGQPAPGAK